MKEWGLLRFLSEFTVSYINSETCAVFAYEQYTC